MHISASVPINISMSTIKKENRRKNCDNGIALFPLRAQVLDGTLMEASRKHIRQNMRKVVQGQCGEFFIQKQLAKLSQDQFAVINNYPIYERTKQAQIDHIVLSAQRVYVIETKTYSGKITGQENEYWWTQQLSHKIVHFRNPFIQNRNHILYLRSILNVNAEFVNIVVFCKAQFHVKPNPPS